MIRKLPFILILAIAMTAAYHTGAQAKPDGTMGTNCNSCHGGGTTNTPPTADAGPTQTVAPGAKVTLNGVGTDAQGTVGYSWRQTAGTAVTLARPTTANPTFTAPSDTVATSLTFELTVTDRGGLTATATTIVNVNAAPAANKPPTANAGADKSSNAGDLVTLNGSGTDPEGGPVSYSWKQTRGTAVTLSNAAAAAPTFTAPPVTRATSLTFQLTVADGTGLQATDVCIVTVAGTGAAAKNLPPKAITGPTQVVVEGDTVTLDGTASIDPEGKPISCLWTQLAGPAVTLSDPTSASPTFTAPVPATKRARLKFRLVVTDSGGLQGKRNCSVTVNKAPVP